MYRIEKTFIYMYIVYIEIVFLSYEAEGHAVY